MSGNNSRVIKKCPVSLREEKMEKRVGILGGGQLGRMMVQAGLDLAVGIEVLDASEGAPCASIASRFVVGSPTSSDDVFDFGKDLSVVTIEMENVSVDGLRRLENSGVVVVPKPEHVAMIQDKGLQKQFFDKASVPTASFVVSENPGAIGFPVVQKVRVGGYDGKGVKILKSQDGSFPGSCVLEQLVDVEAELSVLVARSKTESKTYPCCEQAFNDENVATFIVSPPTSVDESVQNEARSVAIDLAEKMDYVGLLAVELFVTRHDHQVLVNEIAPRPHNSGHHTIEASFTSQFAQLLRIVLDLPLGDTTQRSPYAATINLLGTETGSPPVYHGLRDALAISGVYPHVYAKTKVTPGRKMGHVTILSEEKESLHDSIEKLDSILKVAAS